MGLETPTYIDDLNTLWPLGTDKKYEGDNHIRNVKSVLQTTFKKKDGSTVWDAGVAIDPTDLQNGYVPIGGIIMWYSTIASIPTTGGGATWSFCNGQTVGAYTTPDLRDKFVVGAYADDTVAKTSIESATPGSGLLQSGGTGNATAITSGSTAASGTTDGTAITVDQMPTHSHTQLIAATITLGSGATAANAGTEGYGGTTASSGSGDPHTHTFTGDGHTHTVDYPAYYALAYIMRTS